MPWKGVTVSEERQRFLEDYRLRYYTVSELAERYSISRKTAHLWIDRFEQTGESGFHEFSRRPHGCPGATAPAIVQELVELRKAQPRWGPAKLLDLMHRRRPRGEAVWLRAVARESEVMYATVAVQKGVLRQPHRPSLSRRFTPFPLS